MDTHYFTFGYGHTHPETHEDMRDYWIEIIADSPEKARAKMFELFGNKWGFHYTERKFMKLYTSFPKGCYQRIELD